MKHEYSCTFCGQAIVDPETSVALTATWLRDWQEGVREPFEQTFWSHGSCLEETWKGAVPWEKHILFGVDEFGNRNRD